MMFKELITTQLITTQRGTEQPITDCLGFKYLGSAHGFEISFLTREENPSVFVGMGFREPWEVEIVRKHLRDAFDEIASKLQKKLL